MAAAAYYFWRYTRDERAGDGRWLEGRLKLVLPWAVPPVVVLGFVLGVYYGSFAAAGSDSYGYVSQARLWLAGTLRVAQPLVEQLSWPNREWVFAPLGYRPHSADGTIVPTYPAGLPMVMAVFLGLLGQNGPFFVVPVFAALTLWLTYLLGKEATGSKVAAALAALLLLASPVFLTHLMVPMSDVPAAAGWALVALLALRGHGGYLAAVDRDCCRTDVADSAQPLPAGSRPGVCVAPKARAAPALCVGSRAIAPGTCGTQYISLRLTTDFRAGQVIQESYALSSAPGNILNYTSWLVQTQTPLVALALLPLFFDARPECG